MLDGIFADSYRRWGGRFSLIVPCINGRVSPAYWPWLEAYDPDIVYSYVPLSDEDVLEVHERISPSLYQEHDTGLTPRLDVYGFKPSFNFDILSSLSTIFRSARYRPSPDGLPLDILDSWTSERPSRFFTDNFGTYLASFSTSVFPPDARTAASLLTVVSPDKLADRRFGIPPDLNVISSEMEAMQAFAERRASSLSVASMLFAPKLEFRFSQLGQSFNLVVGNSFEDRIIFWNIRHFIPAWLDGEVACFRVDEEQLEDDKFIDVLKELINRRNFVNTGSGGQSQLTVRSVSIGAEKVNAAMQRLRSAKVWGAINAEVISNLDSIVPGNGELSAATEGNRFGTAIFTRSDWERFTWVPPIAKPSSVLSPDHLSDAPPRQFFTRGSWCSDFVLEQEQAGSRFTNKRNMWELPKRWRMASAFQVEKTGSSREPAPIHRRSRDGRLSVFENTDQFVELVSVPTAYEAVSTALAIDGQWAVERRKHGIIEPNNKVFRAAPSNESRYLEGVIGMAGSARRASQFMLHPYLRQVFAKLGGTPQLDPDQIPSTVNRINKLKRGNQKFDLTDEHDKKALANMIIKAARNMKRPQDHLKYTDLKSDWAEYRRTFWGNQQQKPEPDPNFDWDAQEERDLDNCLIELRKREILFQGHRWTCPRCHHRNWVDLASMNSEFSCEVCRAVQFAPININWQFRANEFLIESLRDHSVLSLLWLLSIFRNQAKRSLTYVGPTWFWYEAEDNEPDAEADLLVLIDGKAVVCEVKASWHSVRRSDVVGLVELAKRLRADRAVLAVMDTGIKLKVEIEAAKNQLGAEGIDFELITARLEGDEPYLMFDDLDDL